MIQRTILLASALLFSGIANAAVYAGNPGVEITLVHTDETITGGTAEIDRIVLLACDGTKWTDPTDVSLDPTTGATWQIPAGDWCGVSVWWSEDVVLTGTSADGFFELTYNQPKTQVSLDPSPASTPLTPYQTTSGTQPAGHPKLVVTIF